MGLMDLLKRLTGRGDSKPAEDYEGHKADQFADNTVAGRAAVSASEAELED